MSVGNNSLLITSINNDLEVLEILYQHLLKYRFTDYISIPSNCSFVIDKKALANIQRYINKF